METPETSDPIVELLFPVQGKTLGTDHGWPLYAALSGVAPEIHAEGDHILIGPVQGAGYHGPDQLRLGTESMLPVRVRSAYARPLWKLAGQALKVRDRTIRLGVPATRLLRPSAELHARVVVITNRMEWMAIEEELRRQLGVLGAQATIHAGARRVVRIRGAVNVGFAVGLSELSDEDSLRVQSFGLGGRRRMGAGFFVPGQLPVGAQATPRDLEAR